MKSFSKWKCHDFHLIPHSEVIADILPYILKTIFVKVRIFITDNLSNINHVYLKDNLILKIILSVLFKKKTFTNELPLMTCLKITLWCRILMMSDYLFVSVCDS